MTTQVEHQKTDERTKILQRVINLRARAEDSGSSEAEMNTALTMAMKLMDSYNIAEAELALAEATGEIKLDIVTKKADTSILKGAKHIHKVVNCLGGIQEFTETRYIRNDYYGTASFTGHRPDVELANYLLAVIKEALNSEYDLYRARTPSVGYGARAAFQSAMANRISQRLYAMARERSKERQEQKRDAEKLAIEDATIASSTALIVSKIAEQKAKEVETAFKKAYPRLRTAAIYSNANNSTAHGAGRAAGDRVNLGKAISKSSTKLLA